MAMAHVRRLEGKKLVCSLGRHTIVTDRKPEDGGADAGCTSGELLLAAIGSCAAGSTRNFLEAQNIPSEELSVDVEFQPSDTPGARDTIVIELTLPEGLCEADIAGARQAALSGGVTSRMRLGSDIELRCRFDARKDRDVAAQS